MKTREPSQEYFKVYKLLRKYETRWNLAFLKGHSVITDRLLKKVKALVKRAMYLEEIMKVPEGRRYTNAYR